MTTNRFHTMRSLPIRCLCICLLILFQLGAAQAQEPVVQIKADDSLLNQGLLEVHFINVASADCFLLRMGEHTMLVDSGTQSTSDRILDYLQTLGVDSLEYAFATHPHDDHIGGFLDVLPAIPVGTFLAPHLYEENRESPAVNLRKTLADLDLPITYVENETTMAFGDAELTFYQWQNQSTTENNRSMILKITYGQRAILLAADLGSNAQKAHVAAYGELLKADILKMPHHGISTYRKELHDVVQPSLATVSNVESNVEENIKLLKARGVDYLFTTKGTIVAVTDGAQWKVWQIPKK